MEASVFEKAVYEQGMSVPSIPETQQQSRTFYEALNALVVLIDVWEWVCLTNFATWDSLKNSTIHDTYLDFFRSHCQVCLQHRVEVRIPDKQFNSFKDWELLQE